MATGASNARCASLALIQIVKLKSVSSFTLPQKCCLHIQPHEEEIIYNYIYFDQYWTIT